MYFSDYFEVSPETLSGYGAFNVSLVNDLPLFIDPFLLFNSEKEEYQTLHSDIIRYLSFLREQSAQGTLSDGLVKNWYSFPEVKQTWLGFSLSGNKGSGLGHDFARGLNENLNLLFPDFGAEKITKDSHLEKLCLVKDGVGRDSISDFTTNLIKGYLLEYTQTFAQKHIDAKFRDVRVVEKVKFNYKTRSWMPARYELPIFDNDYVILTPFDLLTKDDTWINKDDLVSQFHYIPEAIPNEELRAQVNNYFHGLLTEDAKKKQVDAAIIKTLKEFPELLDYYIKRKEETGEQASELSYQKVMDTQRFFLDNTIKLTGILEEQASNYLPEDTLSESHNRVLFLKNVIENKDGYKVFYDGDRLIKLKENDIHILYRLTWYHTKFDVNREVNNGRGPVDFKISSGSQDSTLVEFKLAKNTKLKQNLENQVEVYKTANDTQKAIKVIFFFNESEETRVKNILKELSLENEKYVVLVDARADNKPSASTV